jgi:hypothetical protein
MEIHLYLNFKGQDMSGGTWLRQLKKCLGSIFKRYAQLFIAWAVVLIIWIVNWIGLVGFYSTGGERGTFGDMFGGVNALFTGLAFATLIYTAWMQQRELRLQRMALKLQRGELRLQRLELSHTREEIKGQKEQLQFQSTTFELQRFESTFFALVSVHQGNLAKININGRDGSKGVSSFLADFREHISNTPKFKEFSTQESLNFILTRYVKDYQLYQGRLGPYFRHLYQLFKFIKASSVENKKLYSSIVRAQLSDAEQLILFYNCLSVYGIEKFKPLVEEFSLLNNLQVARLIRLEYKSLYNENAYL